MMLAQSPTPYSSLPSMPTVNALPGGVPYGPWSALYRSAPGAQIPSVIYPGMTYQPGRREGQMRGFGAASAGGVTLLGPLGQTNTAFGALGNVLVTVAIAAGIGAVNAMTIRSKHPVRNTALANGGIALAAGLLTIGLAKAGTAAEPLSP